MDVMERRKGTDAGSTRLLPWLETAGGVTNAAAICAASPRVVAGAFGAEDFTADMGIARTEAGAEVAVPRSLVPIAARVARVIALDTPFVNFRDPEGLRRDAEAARSLGYRGKFAIHPSQIETINAVFSPSAEEVDYARRGGGGQRRGGGPRAWRNLPGRQDDRRPGGGARANAPGPGGGDRA